MAELDGRWNVERVGGFLPPLIGVRKEIEGSRGRTTVGPIRAAFDVVGRELRYTGAVHGLRRHARARRRRLGGTRPLSRPCLGRVQADSQVTGAPRVAALPSNRYGLPTSGLL